VGGAQGKASVPSSIMSSHVPCLNDRLLRRRWARGNLHATLIACPSTRRLSPTSISEGMVPSSILTTIIERRGGDGRRIDGTGAGQLAVYINTLEATLQLGSIRGISLKELSSQLALSS
jgi:hypothetical protein